MLSFDLDCMWLSATYIASAHDHLSSGGFDVVEDIFGLDNEHMDGDEHVDDDNDNDVVVFELV